MNSTTTIPAPPPTFPLNVTKTITFSAQNQIDYDYLNSEDEFPADVLSFAGEIAVTVLEIDGKRV